MKRIYLIVSMMVVLFGGVLLLDTYRATFTVQAQADPNAPAAPNTLYLPLISLSVPVPTPTPTPPSVIKSKSGIHMGNRESDWQNGFFLRLRGKAEGQWPAATVVLSNQLYTLNRDGDYPCRVNDADVRSQVLYQYLSDAIHAGTIIVIRIYPSPGNFEDFAKPGREHYLLSNDTPAGHGYCGNDQSKESEKYRDIRDIVQEMKAIYHLNVTEHKWPPDRFYFEPTNEPNNEWYMDIYNRMHKQDPEFELVPNSNNKSAWQAMDEYFNAII